MQADTENGNIRKPPAETTRSAADSISPPARLAASIEVGGLIVTEHHFTAGAVLEAIKNVFLRLDTILADTPSFLPVLPSPPPGGTGTHHP
ncbi:hypothetical protein [Methanogenium cariaci]|uniref:hypothetical protein n=1 Tax=Methanogenium cariaci TaxID=2197 RepID=UPI0012F6FF72|nr:hypothetical protein [Methanogenium cariaci]